MSPVKVGLVGKTNTGKTTFFNAATLQSAEVSTYPFTTKTPNAAMANAITLCACREFDISDSPRNSVCIDGWRHVPVELIDLPGLIKGAHAGKGLGNQFLSVASQSDAILHIVDVSGSVDEEGKITEPGKGNPVADIYDIEEELVLWLSKIIERGEEKIVKDLKSGEELSRAIHNVVGGIKITEEQVARALASTDLARKEYENWTPLDDKRFAKNLRELSKPTLILANKIDLPTAAENFERMQEQFPDKMIVPCSAEAELILRRAEQKSLIRYVPGQEAFEIKSEDSLNERQRWALNQVSQKVLGEYMRTGVQFALNVAVFKLLKMNAIYPVYDPQRLSDKQGKLLPDVYLMSSGSTVFDLAREIHTELAKGLLYAIDARSGLRLPSDYTLKDRDVLSIVSATRRPQS